MGRTKQFMQGERSKHDLSVDNLDVLQGTASRGTQGSPVSVQQFH